MNKFKEHIYKYGKWIGEGSSRCAFELKGKIYKIPYRPVGIIQSKNEMILYEKLKNNFFNLFPNPVFHENGVVEMDKVVMIDDISGFWCDNPIDIIIEKQLVSEKNLQNFFYFTEVAGKMNYSIDDLFYNGGNIGVLNDQIKIIDWGYTNSLKPSDYITTTLQYKKLQERLELFTNKPTF